MRSCRRRDCARRGWMRSSGQKDPALKEVVEQLARGDVREAISNLNGQGRVHEIGDRSERIAEIAREYVRQPENTLVVSPDNESRREINSQIHRAMQGAGQVKRRAGARAECAARADGRRPAARAELRGGRCNPLLERVEAVGDGGGGVCEGGPHLKRE